MAITHSPVATSPEASSEATGMSSRPTSALSTARSYSSVPPRNRASNSRPSGTVIRMTSAPFTTW